MTEVLANSFCLVDLYCVAVMQYIAYISDVFFHEIMQFLSILKPSLQREPDGAVQNNV